ncbi:MAG TPA: hypothetical protein VFA50_20590 [Stellaceae bacterium]|nr:hypothetical protein [Stellaceae bacterium]
MSLSRADGVEEEGAEGYFASVSDLMVGILFVFLLMLTVFALNYRDAEDDQKIERGRYEQALKKLAEAERQAKEAKAEAERQAAEAARQKQQNDTLRGLLTAALDQLERDIRERAAAREQLLMTLETALKERGVKVEVDTHSGVLRLSGDLLFETGKSSLNIDARRTVQLLADVLARVLPCYAASAASTSCDGSGLSILETVLIEGHTDRQRFANADAATSAEKNDKLSTERALAVFGELRRDQQGLEALQNDDRLPLLGVSGYGERRPLPQAQGTSEADFKQNRRIDLRFVLSARSSRELERLRDQIHAILGQVP